MRQVCFTLSYLSMLYYLGFDKYGRVHIIGHSLGSVLSAYILSKQPTYQPPLSEIAPQQLSQCRDTFLFNTRYESDYPFIS